LRADARALDESHPLDTYVRTAVLGALEPLAHRREARFSFEPSPRRIAMQRLAHVSGFAAVGKVLGVPERAEVVASLTDRVEAVRQRAVGAPRLRCALLEWIDPPFCAGHWGPELVEIAGGTDPLGRRGEDSVAIPWDTVLEAVPEVLVVACCGYSVERALGDLPILQSRPGFATLPAVQRGEVYVVDGSAYFSRPGPRIVDSLEILAGILHPEIFRGQFPERSVLRVR
jgi:iron complex transport system substrate-binding protein